MKVYWGGACLDRPRMRMSQMAASVESRGMNLMHSRLFLKACSSGGKESVCERVRGGAAAVLAPPTRVHRLLDGDEAHGQRVLDVDQLHVHQNVAQVALQEQAGSRT